MTSSIPDIFYRRAQTNKDSAEEPFIAETKETTIPKAFYKRAQQQQQISTPIEEEKFLVGPGLYATRSQIEQLIPPGGETASRQVLGPLLSETSAGLVGLPSDIINAIGGYEESPIGQKIHEYAGSEGLKKYITEPVREKIFGTPDEEELETQFSRRLGKNLGPGILAGPTGLLAALGGATAGQYAEEKGWSPEEQNIAEFIGFLGPSATRNLAKFLGAAPKKTPGGITQLRAIEKENLKKSAISPERKQEVLQKLNKEAAQVGKKYLEEKLPISKEIEYGIDFNDKFKKQFDLVRRLAKPYKIPVNNVPIQKFFEKTLEKYSGVPKLHSEATSIAEEIKSFAEKPPQTISEYLNTYRANNKKITDIYEKAKTEGKKQEIVNFLEAYNKAILSSFRSTLHKESPFLQLFLKSNKDFKNYKDALSARNILEPVLGENPTISKLSSLADNEKLQKRLALKVGQKKTNQFVKLSNDLKKAHQTLDKMPVKAMEGFNAIMPLYYFMPLPAIVKYGISVPKFSKGAQLAYGRFLTTPKRASAYDSALQALIAGDKKAYSLAATKLMKEIEETEEAE